MKSKTILLAIAASALFTISCSGQQSDRRQGNQQPPSVDQIFKELDEDEDDLLSKEEVRGPLKDMFTEIDTNEDGFLSKEEVEEAPKPKGGRRNKQ